MRAAEVDDFEVGFFVSKGSANAGYDVADKRVVAPSAAVAIALDFFSC